MTKKIVLIILLSFVANMSFAQRWAFVDSEYVLNRLPQYREAQNELDKTARKWQSEINELTKEYEKMKLDLANEKVFLTNDLIQDRQIEIDEKFKAIEDLKQKRFGPEGDLISQRKQLVKPIQDQIFNAVQSIAKKKRYDAVFDKSSDLIMLYYNKKYDVSDEVLKIIKSM
jgi:Skp family chaperone for outer membrane proteins